MNHGIRVGDSVQINPNVKVGRWLVGGYLATVMEVVNTGRNTGLWVERRNAYDFPILLKAGDVTFIRHARPAELGEVTAS